jgi:hypothetical protein
MRLDRALGLLAILAASAVPAAADTQLVTAVSIEEAGAPKQELKQTVWLGQGKLRQDTEDTSQIILASEKKAYFIDHQDKTYSVLTLPVDLSKLVPADQRARLELFVESMKMDTKVTATDERKKIRDWNARKYSVEMASPMGKIEVTVWATKDIKVDAGAYREMIRDIATLFPGAAENSEQTKKIEGISVLTETFVAPTSFKRREELLSAEEKSPPTGTYAPPAGYKEIPYNPFAKMVPDQQ